jgi:hypothetical protein
MQQQFNRTALIETRDTHSEAMLLTGVCFSIPARARDRLAHSTDPQQLREVACVFTTLLQQQQAAAQDSQVLPHHAPAALG